MDRKSLTIANNLIEEEATLKKILEMYNEKKFRSCISVKWFEGSGAEMDESVEIPDWMMDIIIEKTKDRLREIKVRFEAL